MIRLERRRYILVLDFDFHFALSELGDEVVNDFLIFGKEERVIEVAEHNNFMGNKEAGINVRTAEVFLLVSKEIMWTSLLETVETLLEFENLARLFL